MRNDMNRLGASPGLTPFVRGGTHAEQVYLKRDPTSKDVPIGDDVLPARPYVIEGWQGYDVCHRIGLTREQARWLVTALTLTLLDDA